jgi:NADH-quinone oxidoreductase subunit K
MNPSMMHVFWTFGLFIIMLFVIGIYCAIVTHNLIRVLIGLEIIMKGVTLLIIVGGYISGHQAIAQSMVITLIVIEAVMITVAVGIIFGIRDYNNSTDTRRIRRLKG